METKINLSNDKISQISGTSLNLSGDTTIYGNLLISSGGTLTGVTSIFSFACSDEVTDLTVSNALITLIMPVKFILTNIIASVTTPPSGSTLIIDVNLDNISILGTKLSIDSGENSSITASTPPVIINNNLIINSILTVDIDQIGLLVAGTGLKIYLIGRN